MNGLIEKTRDKKKSSIAAAAKEFGMPRKLIDIRHGKQTSTIFVLSFSFSLKNPCLDSRSTQLNIFYDAFLWGFNVF